MVEALFVSIPESVGLLAFGLGLIGAAATGRWLLSRSEEKKKRRPLQSKGLEVKRDER